MVIFCGWLDSRSLASHDPVGLAPELWYCRPTDAVDGVDFLDSLEGFCYFIIGQIDEFGVSTLSQSGMFGFLTSGELALAATSLSDCWPLQLCWLCPVGGQSWQYQQFCHWTHLSTRQWISWSRRTWWPFKGDLRMSLNPVSMDWFGDCSNGLRSLLWSVFYVCRLSRGRLVRVTDSFVHMHSMFQVPRFFLPCQSMLFLWWLSVAPLAPTMSVFISVKTALSSTQTIVLFQEVSCGFWGSQRLPRDAPNPPFCCY